MDYVVFIGNLMTKLWNMLDSIESPFLGISWAVIRLGFILLFFLVVSLNSVVQNPIALSTDKLSESGDRIRRK